MENALEFIYRKEFWYASCFLVNEEDGVKIAKDIEEKVRDFVAKISVDKLEKVRDEVIKAAIIEMGKSADINVSFHPYIPGFRFLEENTTTEYSLLGFLQFEVEYFKSEPERKAEIAPISLQQIPLLVRDLLKEEAKCNRSMKIDTDSNLFVFVVSDRTVPEDIEWTQANIEQYKHELAYWNEIYSGAWPDYNDQLYKLAH